MLCAYAAARGVTSCGLAVLAKTSHDLTARRMEGEKGPGRCDRRARMATRLRAWKCGSAGLGQWAAAAPSLGSAGRHAMVRAARQSGAAKAQASLHGHCCGPITAGQSLRRPHCIVPNAFRANALWANMCGALRYRHCIFCKAIPALHKACAARSQNCVAVAAPQHGGPGARAGVS